MFIIGLLLIILSQVVLTLEKAYFYLPLRELQRRAKRGDAISRQLASITRYDGELRVLLLTVALLAAAGGLVIFVTRAPFIMSFVMALLLVGYGLIWQPRSRLGRWEVALAQRAVPSVVWILSKIHTVLRPLARMVDKQHKPRRHTGLFELDDLTELLNRQQKQRDNRIVHEDIARLRTVLDFKKITVQNILISPDTLAPISVLETISPVFLDELHRMRMPYIPVYDELPERVVGLLAMHHISDVRPHGRVGDNTDYHISVLRPDDSLDTLVQAFYATGQTAFVVQDEEIYQGLALLADALQQLFGPASVPDQPNVVQ